MRHTIAAEVQAPPHNLGLLGIITTGDAHHDDAPIAKLS
jgi:hypothetical protein